MAANMRVSPQIRLFLIVLCVYLVLMVATAAGAFRFLSSRGRMEVTLALNSLLLYSLLGLLAVAVITSWRKRWKEYVLSLVSICVALFVAEGALRMFGVHAAMRPLKNLPSSRYHHTYPPNQKMYQGVFEGNPVVVQTNEDGLRTHYTRAEFRRYQDRVITMGDSFTFGFGVRQEAAFPERLEALLRKAVSSDNLAVLNAGVIAYSPVLEELQFDGLLREYHPTLVLLFLDATDIGDDIIFTGLGRPEGRTLRFPDTGGEGYYGAVYQLASKAIGKPLSYPLDKLRLALGVPAETPRFDYYRFELKIDDVVERNRFFIYRHPLSKTEPYFRATLDHIASIAADAHNVGARFVLVVTPRFHHWNPKESPDNWESWAYTRDEPFQYEYFRFFDERKAEVDFPILNLLPAFQKTDRFPLVFKGDPHWNKNGHAFVAETIAQYLLKESLITATGKPSVHEERRP
jgi:hypothetical protein